MMRRYLSVLIIVLLAACSTEPTITSEPIPSELVPTATHAEAAPRSTRTPLPTYTPLPIIGETIPFLMSVERLGGLCCQTSLVIGIDGSLSIGHQTVSVVNGKLSADQLAELVGLIEQTDVAAIKAVRLTAPCPPTREAQRMIYNIAMATGIERLSSCEVVIDPTLPLFAWLDALLTELLARPADPYAPIARVSRYGGECMEKECHIWLMILGTGYYKYEINATINGEAQTVDEPYSGPAPTGDLTADQLAELLGLIEQTDFEAILAVPAADPCPAEYDGRDVNVYSFYSPTGVDLSLVSCEVEIDHTLPLIAWLDALLLKLSGWPADEPAPLIAKIEEFGMMGEFKYTIDRFGTIRTPNGSTKTLTAAEMMVLFDLIVSTDFDSIPPLTETCPIIIDVPITTYTFMTRDGLRVIGSCDYEIDPDIPLFAWINAVMAEGGS